MWLLIVEVFSDRKANPLAIDVVEPRFSFLPIARSSFLTVFLETQVKGQ
jgi:hypothetical protein